MNNIKDMSRTIFKIRKNNNLTQKEFADKINVSEAMISLYESGSRSPKMKTIGTIAEVFGYKAKDLIFASDDKEIESRTFKIKLFLDPVCAGDGTLIEDNKYENLITLDAENYKKQDNLFAVKIKGDSMVNAHICEGDIAICKPQVEFNNNDIVIATNEGKGVIKRYKHLKNTYMLMPENVSYEPIIVNENTRIIGKVIEIRKFYN